MFVDIAQILVKAGDGGDGSVSFRHEKFIDKGGPDGGDGGDGGDVVLLASRNQSTLASFRYQRELKADSGLPGFKRRKHGRSGADLTIDVPVGTVVVNDAGQVIADFIEDGQTAVVAFGGKGGFGNAHFTSSTRQTPRFAEKGEPGDELSLKLELKMIADVGLIGLPNAGKSTLLSRISNARPEIADYPFTTLRPNLGVVDLHNEQTLLFADIPGLIEGASQGKGLGDDFLRHVERTKVLVQLIDAYDEDVASSYSIVDKELAQYAVDLTQRPRIIVLNKIDGMDEKIVSKKLQTLKKVAPKGASCFAISAQSGAGIPELLAAAAQLIAVQQAAVEEAEAPEALPVLSIDNTDSWQVVKNERGFEISGTKIERFASRTDFHNYQAVQRLRDIMRKLGIMHELIKQGAAPGDKLYFGKRTDSIEY